MRMELDDAILDGPNDWQRVALRCIDPGNSRSRAKNSTIDGDLARSQTEAITTEEDDALHTCQSEATLISENPTYLALA